MGRFSWTTRPDVESCRQSGAVGILIVLGLVVGQCVLCAPITSAAHRSRSSADRRGYSSHCVTSPDFAVNELGLLSFGAALCLLDVHASLVKALSTASLPEACQRRSRAVSVSLSRFSSASV